MFAVRTAAAAVCVELDTTKDTLSEPDRNATRILLGQALQQQGQQVADANCMGVYRVYHVKLGNSITVFMQGPGGYREGSVRAIEEIPAIYSQMIRSLLTGQPMTTHNGTVDRTNATSAQQAPRRVEADSLWYVRLGYAGVMNPIVKSGPALGFGYRYELDSIGIDFSFFNFMVASDNDSNNSGSLGITGSWVKLMGLYYLNPTANSSTYLGAGISWGAVGGRRGDQQRHHEHQPDFLRKRPAGRAQRGIRVPARQHDPHVHPGRRDPAVLHGDGANFAYRHHRIEGVGAAARRLPGSRLGPLDHARPRGSVAGSSGARLRPRSSRGGFGILGFRSTGVRAWTR